jgi:pyrroline-5-carboxylate reductase
MKLGFIGAGNMASALARGIGEPVLVSDPERDRAERLAADVGGEALGSNAEVAAAADVVVLCHKPKQLDDVASEIAGEARAVASILAAVRIAELERAYPARPVYRLLPNVPVGERQGIVCYADGTGADPEQAQELRALLGRAGIVIGLDEPLLEPAMAVMSCGPAFFALAAEALGRAGERHGLEPGEGVRMAAETMAGAAAWLRERGYDTDELKRTVATPGGVTEKGLRTLEEQGAPEAFAAAVDTVVEATR